MWTDILCKACQCRVFQPEIVSNQSEEDSSDDLQEEGEGVWSNGEDGDESDDDFVESAHEVEGEPDEGEGISSSGKGRDETDEHVDLEIKGGNVYSQ